jgi:N-acetylmuramoyl-L-alanine amidase
LPIEDLRRHDALQSLLAFATLRQQVLERGKQSGSSESAAAKPNWQIDSFALDDVLQLVAERALTITGADGIAIALAEEDAIICRASSGSAAPDAGAKVNPNSGFSGACLVSGQVIRCDDAENDARVDAAACRRLGARSMLAVPLSAKQTVIGLIEAFSSEPCGFNDCDVRSLDLLGELILAALRPEDEDRLAEISRNVVAKSALETAWPGVRTATALPDHSDDREADKDELKPAEANVEVPAVSRLGLAGYTNAEPSRPGLLVVVGVLCLAITLGGTLWWVIQHKSRFNRKVEARSVPTRQSGSSPSMTGSASSESSPGDSSDDDTALESPAKPGEITTVTGIRHWSSSDSSTVVIDIENQVQYEAHRLSSPERIYFDLHDTKLAAGLAGKPIEVQDAFLQRIRVAQSANGITRVVLETKGSPDFSVSLQQDPYRLVVEVQKPGSKPRDRANIDLFAPMTPGSPASANAASLPPQSAAGSAAKANGEAAGLAPGAAPALRIALDAGHGGWDLGTAGKSGLLEKDLVLDIVARLGELVASRMGAKVIYTRQNDDYVSLEKRAEIANLARADLFLSVHANHSGSASARGAETYYTNTYSSVKARDSRDGDPSLKNINWTNVDIREKVHESHRFAVSVQRALYGTLAASNPGLPNRGVKQAEYVVLTGTSMPAVLAEVSFVSSPADEGNLKSAAYRQQIAEALYQGIARYAKDAGRVSLASGAPKPALR